MLDDKNIKKRKLANGDWGVPGYQGYQVAVGTEEELATAWSEQHKVEPIADFKSSESLQQERIPQLNSLNEHIQP